MEEKICPICNEKIIVDNEGIIINHESIQDRLSIFNPSWHYTCVASGQKYDKLINQINKM